MDFSSYLIQNGVATQTVFLLLALPFLALLVSFSRQLIGLKTFSMYEPLVLAYALYFISPSFIDGLKIGLPIIVIAWAVSEITRRVLEKFRLHYISKVSLKISLAAVIILGLMSFAAYFNLVAFTTVNPFAVILLITLVESVSLFQVKIGSLKTNLVSLETLLVAVFSYLFLASVWVSQTLINYPYLVFLPIFLNFFVGRLQGLRLSEFVRFREIFKND
jgi:hypothetical protein